MIAQTLTNNRFATQSSKVYKEVKGFTIASFKTASVVVPAGMSVHLGVTEIESTHLLAMACAVIAVSSGIHLMKRR